MTPALPRQAFACRAAAVPFAAQGPQPNGPPLDADPHVFGFVCGVHFSGTSILHYTLGRNPEIAIMHVAPKRQDEGQGFQDVLPTGALSGAPGRGHGCACPDAAPCAAAEVGRAALLSVRWVCLNHAAQRIPRSRGVAFAAGHQRDTHARAWPIFRHHAGACLARGARLYRR